MSKRSAVVALFAALVIAVAWSPASSGSRSYPQAPMQISTEGLTAEEQIQRQADLSLWLLSEAPGAALGAPVRVEPSREEIDAVEQSSRSSVPMKIGLVKAMTPGIEVDGLTFGGPSQLPRKGATLRAVPTPDGGAVWTMPVVSDDAGAIRLHVDQMSLPPNAALYVYNRDGEAFGPYTDAGPEGSGEFWTTAVFGSEAILQIRLTAPVAESDLMAVSLRVEEAGIITRAFTEGLRRPDPTALSAAVAFCGNASCIVDATCVNATPADPAKLAVAKMEWVQGAFIYTCTGGLIADNNPTQSNFFLTANHCLSKNNAAQRVDFYWRFATPSCNGTCPSNATWPFKTTGATVSASNRKGDFTLLHLNTAPPAGSVFLGWSSAPVANTSGAQLWRISNPGFGPQVYSQHNVDTATGTCSGWPRGQSIYSRDIDGAIDGGSSGSPIVNSSSQIVGQLSGTCGSSPSQVCSSGPGEANATVDGAFAFYFATVSPILDP